MLPLPHAFADPSLLALALTHASLGLEADNERLEFLGDAALDLIVAEELFRAWPGLDEGRLTERKAQLVSRAALARAARALDLGSEARVGAGLRGRTLPGSVLANLYEAVLGAVYLDAGLEAARAFVRATLGPALDVRAPEEEAGHPKQVVQQIAQRRGGLLPSYPLLTSRGEAHARAFLVAAEIGGRRFPSAWGRTRKEAERWAAYEALLVLDEEGAT